MDKVVDLTQEIEKKIDRSRWKTLKFSDFAENIVEKVFPKDSGLEHYIGLEHLDSGSLHIKRFGETASLVGDKLKIYKGDLIFAKRNAYLKRVAIADFDAVASAHSLVLRAKSENVLPEFLPFFMLSETFWEKAIEISVGSLSPTINWKALAKQEFLLPPKDQQVQLTELLWAMDDMVVENDNQLNRFEVFFHSWLNSEINIRRNWNRKPLYHVAKIQTGIAKNENLKEENDTVELPYIRVANVQDGYLDLAEIKSIFVREKDVERFSLQEGDLLLTEGGDFDKLGRGYVWHNEIKNCLHQNHIFAVRADKKYLLPMFLSLVTRSKYGKQYFLSCAKKTSNLASINSTQLKEFRVFVPTLSEQEAILERMKAINSTYELMQKNKLFLINLQKSLINQIF